MGGRGKIWNRLCQVTAATPETDLVVSEGDFITQHDRQLLTRADSLRETRQYIVLRARVFLQELGERRLQPWDRPESAGF